MQFFNLKFSHKVHEFNDVYSFFFDPLEPIEYEAGQWVHLKIGDGREFVRHMSFASAPHEDQISFGADVSSQTDFKKKLMILKEGDQAQLFKIRSTFEPHEYSDTGILCIAGGVGIAPMRSVLIDASLRGAAKQSGLIHVARKGEFMYGSELEQLPLNQARIEFDSFEERLQELLRDLADPLVYIAGSDRFINAVQEKVRKYNVGEGRIRSDVFTGY